MNIELNDTSIKLTGEILTSDIPQLFYSLGWIKATSEKNKHPVKIIFNSEGGATTTLFALYECMEHNHWSMVPDLTTEVEKGGVAASAAAILFISGKKRIVNADSQLLFHFAQYPEGVVFPDQAIENNFLEQENEKLKAFGYPPLIRNLEETNAWLIQIFCSQLDLPISFASELFKQDRFMCAEEAFELGIATDILP